MKAELFQKKSCELAEAPVWHRDLLWWVDIEAGVLHASDGSAHRAPYSIGAALPCTSGRWLLAEEHGFSFWNPGQEPVRFWTRPDQSPDYRFNDASISPSGSLIAGSLKRGTLDGNCSFYELSPNGEVRRAKQGVGLCNGMAWDTDRKRLYFADTGARTVYRCPDYDWERAEPFARMDNGYPDGMTTDTEGNLWVAVWGESSVVCLDAANGHVKTAVAVPAPHVSSCCFGGDDFGTLFITTARQGLNEQQLQQFPESGSIFCCRPGTCGKAARVFNDEDLI